MAAKKIALVTGAGTGVGRAAALALMKEGYAVVLAGRRVEMLEAVAAEGAQTPGELLTVSADVGYPASIKALFAKIKERLRPARSSVQQCRHRRAGDADRGNPARQVAGRGRHQFHRRLPVHPGGDQDHEGANPARRTHHQ